MSLSGGGKRFWRRHVPSSLAISPLDTLLPTPYLPAPTPSALTYFPSANPLKNKLFPPKRTRRTQAATEGDHGKLKFRPLHDRVVVKRIEAEEKSKGGMIIPDTAKEKPQEGEVVAVGPGGRDESGNSSRSNSSPATAAVRKWSGTEVKSTATNSSS